MDADSVAVEKPKKPQLKYDPDIPMTKEQAAEWRREQRRKRNRESAAASRQRQRDRIVELEAEIAHWKHQHQQLMARIMELEKAAAYPELVVSNNGTTINTRPPSPEQGAQTVTPPVSPIASASSSPNRQDEEFMETDLDEGTEELRPSKMIFRPAKSKIIPLTTRCLMHLSRVCPFFNSMDSLLWRVCLF
jgi:hypothetical protein